MKRLIMIMLLISSMFLVCSCENGDDFKGKYKLNRQALKYLNTTECRTDIEQQLDIGNCKVYGMNAIYGTIVTRPKSYIIGDGNYRVDFCTYIKNKDTNKRTQADVSVTLKEIGNKKYQFESATWSNNRKIDVKHQIFKVGIFILWIYSFMTLITISGVSNKALPQEKRIQQIVLYQIVGIVLIYIYFYSGFNYHYISIIMTVVSIIIIMVLNRKFVIPIFEKENKREQKRELLINLNEILNADDDDDDNDGGYNPYEMTNF